MFVRNHDRLADLHCHTGYCGTRLRKPCAAVVSRLRRVELYLPSR